ncbi:metallophosphoesterase family protein [Ochrobactrum chromiisoli]|uniref:Metallophosphoesterase family protein n=1 Tax=Ochrobactrum chromiisoli TaxID=2993941 RepID=A0ABT3QKT8_9HYPH|nr:metallophosphoesterase family protein [Ochrobactrum chromiisoli]MCX2696224.1 metallophosphoesterase family protein [Ochrobactrum chromiisoli]
MSYVQKTYIADTHFGHEAILGLCNRPFSSVNEMDDFLVDAWNSAVKQTDIVYHLGDFSFGGPAHAKAIFRRLNGRKILILGNHDVDRDGNVLSHLAELDWDQEPTHALVTSDGGERVFLSHYAHRVWPASNRGSVHFYGHSHGKLDAVGMSRDVGVDLPDIAYTPRTFQHLKASLPAVTAFATA